jgi:predicted alpha/beta superfamily hydrolase
MRNYILFFVFIGIFKSSIGYSQDINLKIGIKDSIQSSILSEIRPIIVSLPQDYDMTDKTYPVLYVLDGGWEQNSVQAQLVVSALGLQMIIVSIPNTNRDRDLMPLSRPSYEVEKPEAENFLSFLETELIPHIDENYRTNGKKTLRGRSLSGLFTMYAFLAKPKLFDNYIGNCAGWFADMDSFFNQLANNAFENNEDFNGIKLFVANSLADPEDPNKEIHQSIVDLSQRIQSFGRCSFASF